MKADGVGIGAAEAIVGQKHGHNTGKKTIAPSTPHTSDNKYVSDMLASIEQADRTASTVSRKLQGMANLLNQLQGEKDDIVREQLARFFHVLRAFIREALHPTGDWSSDRILAGKNVNMTSVADGKVLAVKGENIVAAVGEIPSLTRPPTTESVQAVLESIGKAQKSVNKVRNNLSAARAHAARHGRESSGVTL